MSAPLPDQTASGKKAFYHDNGVLGGDAVAVFFYDFGHQALLMPISVSHSQSCWLYRITCSVYTYAAPLGIIALYIQPAYSM